jgi:hypothetical protein
MLANETHMISLFRTKAHKTDRWFHGGSMVLRKEGRFRGEVGAAEMFHPVREAGGRPSRLQRTAHAGFMKPFVGHGRWSAATCAFSKFRCVWRFMVVGLMTGAVN